MVWRKIMKICDNCGKKLGSLNSNSPVNFPMITVEIEAILDMYGTKKNQTFVHNVKKIYII